MGRGHRTGCRHPLPKVRRTASRSSGYRSSPRVAAACPPLSAPGLCSLLVGATAWLAGSGRRFRAVREPLLCCRYSAQPLASRLGPGPRCKFDPTRTSGPCGPLQASVGLAARCGPGRSAPGLSASNPAWLKSLVPSRPGPAAIQRLRRGLSCRFEASIDSLSLRWPQTPFEGHGFFNGLPGGDRGGYAGHYRIEPCVCANASSSPLDRFQRSLPSGSLAATKNFWSDRLAASPLHTPRCVLANTRERWEMIAPGSTPTAEKRSMQTAQALPSCRGVSARAARLRPVIRADTSPPVWPGQLSPRPRILFGGGIPIPPGVCSNMVPLGRCGPRKPDRGAWHPGANRMPALGARAAGAWKILGWPAAPSRLSLRWPGRPCDPRRSEAVPRPRTQPPRSPRPRRRLPSSAGRTWCPTGCLP